MIMQIDPDMMPVMIASVDIDGKDQAEISNYVDNELLPVLESIEGVASVTATGVLDTNLQVTMDQEKIDALNDKIQEKIEEQFADAQKELDDVKQQIQQEKEEAIRDIRRQVAVLSVDIAEKIIRRNLDEKQDQMEMIDRMLDEMLAANH